MDSLGRLALGSRSRHRRGGALEKAAPRLVAGLREGVAGVGGRGWEGNQQGRTTWKVAIFSDVAKPRSATVDGEAK